MRKIPSTLIAICCFSPLAYSQQKIISCSVKEVSGTALTKTVDNIRLGSVIDIPVNALRENGSTYERDDVLDVQSYGEKTTITINRETGEFKFSAWSGSFSSFQQTSKKATGVCTYKQLKL